jgi:hypothetical protein
MSRPPSSILLASTLICLLVPKLASSQSQPATAPSASVDDAAVERDYRQQTANLGGRRSFDQGVLTVTLPRADLWVQADMGEIPTAAGLESHFYFYRCSCGKDKVVGEFALTDYEVNDVIDALRGGHVQVVSVSAMFLGDKPRMMALRFQGEGTVADLAKTLKSALDWVGDARSARQAIQTAPDKPQ